MPALRALGLRTVVLPDAVAALLRSPDAEAAHESRALTLTFMEASPPAARALAAGGWRLEELTLVGADAAALEALEALGSGGWGALRRLNLRAKRSARPNDAAIDAPAALALAAALGRAAAQRAPVRRPLST
jgi:hypothetical protein